MAVNGYSFSRRLKLRCKGNGPDRSMMCTIVTKLRFFLFLQLTEK